MRLRLEFACRVSFDLYWRTQSCRCFLAAFCGTDYANGADACASPPPCKCGFATHRRLRSGFGHPACAISLLSTPGLRSGALVRSTFLVPRHFAFPTLGRYDPATRDSAIFQRWQRLWMILSFEPWERSPVISRFVSRSAGRHPCHRAGSLAGHPGPPAFGECALSCAWPASSRKLR